MRRILCAARRVTNPKFDRRPPQVRRFGWSGRLRFLAIRFQARMMRRTIRDEVMTNE